MSPSPNGSSSACEPSGPRYCLGCGYDLAGLTADRCPECGRAFDAADSTSFAQARKSGATLFHAAWIGVAMLVTGVVIVRAAGPESLRMSGFVLVWGALYLEAVVLFLSRQRQKNPALIVRQRPMLYGALGISGFVVIGLVVMMVLVFLFGLMV